MFLCSLGKSTLLRLIMAREAANSGRVALGEHNILPNYFQQNQAEALDLNLTVLDTLIQVQISPVQKFMPSSSSFIFHLV